MAKFKDIPVGATFEYAHGTYKKIAQHDGLKPNSTQHGSTFNRGVVMGPDTDCKYDEPKIQPPAAVQQRANELAPSISITIPTP